MEETFYRLSKPTHQPIVILFDAAQFFAFGFLNRSLKSRLLFFEHLSKSGVGESFIAQQGTVRQGNLLLSDTRYIRDRTFSEPDVLGKWHASTPSVRDCLQTNAVKVTLLLAQ